MPALNNGAKRALVITEYLTPVNAVASIRWTKLIKYLTKDLGYEIDVLTNRKSYSPKTVFDPLYKYDKSMEKDGAYIVHLTEAAPGLEERLINGIYWLALKRGARESYSSGSSRDSAKASTSASSDSIFRRSTKKRVTDFLQRRLNASRYRSVSRKPVDWARYDVVVSSFGPDWVHKIAYKSKRAKKDVVWIADYRDALAYSANTSTEKNLSFAKRWTALADCVTAVSQGVIDNLNLPRGQKYVVIPNGFDPEDLANTERERDEKFRLVYTGALYLETNAKRDMSPLFDVLSSLIADKLVDPEYLVVEYAGPTEDLFWMQASKAPNVPVVSYGMLPRGDALALQRSASGLVLATWNTKDAGGVVTGKVFEYFAAGVPIVGLCSGDVPDSVTKTMLEKSSTGFCYEEAVGDRSLYGLREYILNLYNEWLSDGITTCNANQDYIESFSYEVLASQMNEVIQAAWKVNHD